MTDDELSKAIAAVIVFGFLGIGYLAYRSVPAAADPRTSPSIANATATELIAAYRENSVAADERLRGKVITVVGIVDSVGKELFGSTYVMLDNDAGVQCVMASDQASHVANLRRGDSVTIRGRCAGSLMFVLLQDCVFD